MLNRTRGASKKRYDGSKNTTAGSLKQLVFSGKNSQEISTNGEICYGGRKLHYYVIVFLVYGRVLQVSKGFHLAMVT